jgi:hypothetical protein
MPATRAYRSKIGRLPYALRRELCERMRDGATGAEVLDWLKGHPTARAILRDMGADDISAVNLTDWRTSGYQDWLRDQDKVEHVRAMAELSMSVVSAAGGDPSAVGSRIVAGKLLELLAEADHDQAQELAKSIALLRAGETDAARLDMQKDALEVKRQTLELAREKFQRDTCALFLKWHDDQRVKDLMSNTGLDNDEKTEALGQMIFGGLWQ